jgi:ketosteroid isomerase-like protein
MNALHDELMAWHEHFSACVRARNFEGGRALFAPDCQCFGTCAEFAADWERLLQTQWIPTWSSTHSFHFLAAPFEVVLSNDGSLACVLTLWESTGIGPEGKTFPRRGRCTTVLRRPGPRPLGWLAVHTHYSLTPHGEPQLLNGFYSSRKA